ncbi:hypothetical protein M5K25_000654 [Dendrobium thyrsiflorum]|uniref:BTB domain-containing protein n=1 Tax=Dendrobium thyrsiflorum TaxID=117978 RepID=A0ABD0VUG6_DENTH
MPEEVRACDLSLSLSLSLFLLLCGSEVVGGGREFGVGGRGFRLEGGRGFGLVCGKNEQKPKASYALVFIDDCGSDRGELRTREKRRFNAVAEEWATVARFWSQIRDGRRHARLQISRSPVFKAMLETEMEENKSGMIKIYDVSYEVLRSFVKYLYTAEVLLDEQMACDLLILAEKYQVKHLKSFCEKFMTSKVNNENVIASYAFAHHHHAKQLIEAALSSIIENISTLTEREEFKELSERDPRLVVEIYEACLTRQVNTAEK